MAPGPRRAGGRSGPHLTYLATEHPDQATVVKPGAGTVARENVVEGRLMIQVTF